MDMVKKQTYILEKKGKKIIHSKKHNIKTNNPNVAHGLWEDKNVQIKEQFEKSRRPKSGKSL